jgi:predicted transcriptional regulator
MTTLKIGIANYEQMKARTLAIARGKHRAHRNDPKIWFTSMESFAKVLSDRNRALLALIAETQPGSLGELSERSGRAKSNLSRTLKTMERYGLVQLRKGPQGTIVPRVPYSQIALAVSLGEAPSLTSPATPPSARSRPTNSGYGYSR